MIPEMDPCPNRECDCPDSAEISFDIQFGEAQCVCACGVAGPVANEADIDGADANGDKVRAEAVRLWNGLPRDPKGGR